MKVRKKWSFKFGESSVAFWSCFGLVSRNLPEAELKMKFHLNRNWHILYDGFFWRKIRLTNGFDFDRRSGSSTSLVAILCQNAKCGLKSWPSYAWAVFEESHLRYMKGTYTNCLIKRYLLSRKWNSSFWQKLQISCRF